MAAAVNERLAAARRFPSRGRASGLCSLALLGGGLTLCAPTARGDFYQWLDEQGHPVISNVRPANPAELRNFELVMREPERAPQRDPAPQLEAARNEQRLIERIESLETRLRQAPAAPAAPPAPPSVYGAGYYPAPPPGYDSGFYPTPYLPWIASYPSIVYPVRSFARRPASAFPRHGYARGFAFHRGRR